MKKTIVFLAFLLAIPLMGRALGTEYNPISVGAGNPEVHIKPDGKITVRSARVSQMVGTTYYLMTKWGPLPMNFTMKTGAKTLVTKRYGGSTTVSQIKLGDYVDVEGEFFVGSDFFGVEALKVKDWSLQEEAGTYSGTILEVQSSSFTLKTAQNPMISVKLATTSSIKKGAIEIPLGRLRKGDTVLSASGVYDYPSNTLTAESITVLQTKTDFLPRNFEGVLKEVVTPNIPATLVVTVGGLDYTVKISEKTPILKKNRSVALLARFVVGDTVRFYGAVREEEKTLTDSLIVDASVVRNLNL